MEIIQIKSPIELLEFLEDKTFKDLPHELWDENLPFYNKLLRLMSLSVDDELCNQILMFKICLNDEVCSITLLDRNERILIYIGSAGQLKELVLYLKSKGFVLYKIVVLNEEIAQDLMTDPNFIFNYGDKKLYTKKNLNSILIDKQINIKEITTINSHLLWDGAKEAMEEGWRYYGGFIDNQLVSYAGVVRVSKHRSEIVAVKTVLESNRNKGYASFLCNFLIEEA